MRKTAKPLTKLRKQSVKETFPTLTNEELKSRNISILKYEFNNFFSPSQRIFILVYAISLIASFSIIIFALISQKTFLEGSFLVAMLYLLSLLYLLVRRVNDKRLSFWENYLLNNPDNYLKVILLTDDYRDKINCVRKKLSIYFFVLGTLCLLLLLLFFS